MSLESRWPPCCREAFTPWRASRGEYVTRVTSQLRMNQNDEPRAGMQLLASVRYFLFSSLPQDRQDDLRQVLDSNGATPAATLKDATHIITNAYRFEGLGEVDGEVHVVTVRVACFWKEWALSDLFIGPMG